jgi:hypothetical protein
MLVRFPVAEPYARIDFSPRPERLRGFFISSLVTFLIKFRISSITNTYKAMAELKELHFRIGEGFGKLLMQIAQEHLLYNHNIQKALDTLSDLPPELQLKVLKGDYVMHVDEESQQLLVGQREEGIDDEYPRIDVKDWCIGNIREITTNGNGLKKAIDEMLYHMKYKKLYRTYDYSMIIDFITTGDSKHIIDDLMESEEISQLALLIDVTKRYIEKSVKIMSVMDWMKKTYPDEVELVANRSESGRVLQLVTEKLTELLRCDLSEVQKESEILDNYIEAAQEIDKIMSEGIEPVNIMDNYSAGWLSPEGDYYALNGEIANMLHIQIASALQDKGIIPDGDEVNPDAWLEQQGWVKIHDSNVQFAGCLNEKINRKNVDLTPIQIKKIYEYGALCHNGMLKVGWRMERLSAIRFKDMAETDIIGLYKKYFEY